MTRPVLHVTAPIVGGVPNYVADLVNDQIERGWDVAVATPPDGDLAGQLEGSEAKVLGWKARRDPGITVPTEALRLAAIVERIDPDIVHLHSAKAGLAGRLALRGRHPTIFQPHGWSFDAVDGSKRSAAIAWERLAARWTDALICVSADERDRGAELFDATWRVIRNGVRLDAFRPAGKEDRRAARDRLGLNGHPVAVCVGRLSHEKGQDLLVEAWPSVTRHVPGAQLVLIGDGPARKALEAADDGDVLFAGHRTDVPDWLAAADVVAVPSRRDGMSLAMLEAMACGRSVVACDVGGAREALDATCGALVPAERVDLLAEALVERLRDARRSEVEGLEAHRRAAAFHDFRTVADSVAELYADVALGRTSLAPVGEVAPAA